MGSQHREEEEKIFIPTSLSVGKTGMDGDGTCKAHAEEACTSASVATLSNNSLAEGAWFFTTRELFFNAVLCRCTGHTQNLFSCFPPTPSEVNKSSLITLDFPTAPQKPPEKSHKTLSEHIKAPELKHKSPEERDTLSAPQEVP